MWILGSLLPEIGSTGCAKESVSPPVRWGRVLFLVLITSQSWGPMALLHRRPSSVPAEGAAPASTGRAARLSMSNSGDCGPHLEQCCLMRF